MEEEKIETSIEESCDELIAELVSYNASLQIAHWMADTITNEHRTLGELYDSMVGLTDKFVEMYMGKYGVIEFKKSELEKLDKPASIGCEVVDELCAQFGEDDEELLNVLYDMHATLYKAKYLLKEGK